MAHQLRALSSPSEVMRCWAWAHQSRVVQHMSLSYTVRQLDGVAPPCLLSSARALSLEMQPHPSLCVTNSIVLFDNTPSWQRPLIVLPIILLPRHLCTCPHLALN
jgi:hypothetical protein